MNKKELRVQFLSRRKQLDNHLHQLFNTMLLNRLEEYLDSLNIKHIAIFYPMHQEVDLRELRHRWHLYYPKIVHQDIQFYKDTGVFESAPFNTTVPAHDEVTPLEVIEAILVPGIVYGHNFYRIGYGKGYYDRLLKHYKGLKIGVCFELFLLESVPYELHDEKVDMIVTDQRILKR